MVMLLEFMLRVVLLLVPGRVWLLAAIPVGSDSRLFFPCRCSLMLILPAVDLVFELLDCGSWSVSLTMDGTPMWMLIMLIAGKALGWLIDPLGRNPEAGALLRVFYDGCCCRPMYLVHHMEQGRLLAGLEFYCSKKCGCIGFSFGSDAPVCWVSSTGDGWTTALVFGVDDPSGGRSWAAILMWFSAPEVVVVAAIPFGAIATPLLPLLLLGCVKKYG
ncbi:hypothetical protein Nepgr_018018 [Nepenthes gracilis]|uniref:Uncharacterized protein n=1 Tax=Nepenthes gracilis TaxID=150966 RepID=A0AAD3SS91_NEPGR|nr:hypothetical protein Nepgr_018018 [Nepenthes gracilis]